MQTCLAIPNSKQTSKVHGRPWNALATITTTDCKSNAPIPLPSWVFSDWHLARATSTTYRMDGAKHSFVWTVFLSHSSVHSGNNALTSVRRVFELVNNCWFWCFKYFRIRKLPVPILWKKIRIKELPIRLFQIPWRSSCERICKRTSGYKGGYLFFSNFWKPWLGIRTSSLFF